MSNSAALAGYLKDAQTSMELVHGGLTRGFPAAKREVGLCGDALHAIRNARTILELGGDTGRQRHQLVRFAPTPDGVFGRFLNWVTAEEEEKGNQPGISCIPANRIYLCRRSFYHKGGYETFEVTGVPNRSRILWHVLNTEEGTEGCIGPGKRLGVLKVDKPEEGGPPVHKLAVLESKPAFAEIMAFFKGVDEWELEVRDYAA